MPGGVPRRASGAISRGGRPRVSVVVPTYNEVDNVPILVRRIAGVMPDAEIVVVDDASPDGTADRARELQGEYPVIVVERKDERGLSTAVLRGLAVSRSEVCVVMDADLSHPPEAITALVRAVEDGAAIAVGSRYVKGGLIEGWPLPRRLASRIGTLLARPLTTVRDPLAGFFCLRRSLLRGVGLKPRGFKILLEILARARPGTVVEVPIRFEDREAGKSKFSTRQQREYVAQLWSLYTELNAWPMTWNYTLNRRRSFRARAMPLIETYLCYGLGVLAGVGVQVGVMHALFWMHYAPAAVLGIIAGTVFNFAASELWAFAGQHGAPMMGRRGRNCRDR
jgi:glycosyltransferase involved in cell wall biosynthesis